MSFWPLVEYHRRLLARESGTVVKEPGGRLSLALLYPNTYSVGMANLGLAVIYRRLNRRAGLLCERAFLPDGRSRPLYRKTGAPLLTLESSRPVGEFPLVLASVSFENDAPNLAAMLELAGLGRRPLEEPGPLVIAGGVVPMLNPEPLAELVDGFLLGEAEVVLEPLVERFLEVQDMPRKEALWHLARRVPGFYAPSFYRVEYHRDGRLKRFEPTRDLPRRIPVPKYLGPAAGLARSRFQAPGPQFGQMRLIEVGRGCGHACRFCAAGHILRPPRLGRARDFAAPALEAARRGERVGLVSSAVSDLEGIDELARRLVEAGGGVSLSSLRADRLSPGLARALAASRLQSVALAPEAGSPGLRRAINKHLDEEQLARAVERLIQAGVPNLKLYFMVGLPGEEDEDIEELIALVRRLRQQVVSLARGKGRLGHIGVSLASFVPKPWTPFQWEPMAPEPLLRRRIKRVQRELGRLSNLRVNSDLPKYALLQGALARGDRRLGRLIRALAADPSPRRAWRSTGLDPGFFANRRRERDELMPWAFLDHGLEMDYLWQEAEQARRGRQTPPCRPDDCRRCGVCPASGETSHQGTHDEVPAVHQDEQHELEG